jgi:DNA-binding transcriptional LysR family regulator
MAPADLQGHACLGYTLAGTGADWRLREIDGTGDVAVLPVAGPIRADNGDILRLAALAGAGVVFQPWFIVGADIASGKLVHLLPDWHSPELGVYAVYPSRKHLSAKVRTFVDFLVAALAG